MVRFTLIPICMAAALLSGTASAQTARCADIQDNAARLACYDRAARRGPIPTTRATPPATTTPTDTPPTGTPPTRTAPAGTPPTRSAGPARTPPGSSAAGSWQVLTEPNAAGGENLFLLTYATGRRPEAERPALTINCENGKLTLYVRWQREAGAKIHKVTYTIDGGQPQVMAMAHSKDTYATGLWHPRGAALFTKRLAGHDRLTVSFTAADGTPMAAVFPIDGLDQMMERLTSSCRF